MPEVSQVTLRRDIAELADAGALRRPHGGSVLPESELVKRPAPPSNHAGAEGDLEHLDAVIVPPILGRGGIALRRHIAKRDMPYLAESAPQYGGIYLGPDNRTAGRELGQVAGRSLNHLPHAWVLLIGQPELPNTRERVDGFIKGLRDRLGDNWRPTIVA
jgi:DNA-binding LacI/PurR family transcriptional regulator